MEKLEKVFHKQLIEVKDVPLERIEESTRKWVNSSFSYQTLYSKKNNLKVSYSKKELVEWANKDPNFLQYLKEWISSDYSSKFKPVVRRKDNYKGFEFANIEIVPCYVAINKSNNSEKVIRNSNFAKNSKNNLRTEKKPVAQYTLAGEFVKNWPSVRAAEKALNLRNSDISDVCNKVNNRLTAGGFKWEFVNLTAKKGLF